MTAARLNPETVDRQWVTLIFVAVSLGLVMAFSASYPEACRPRADAPPGDALSFFKMQLGFAGAGLLIGWLSSYLPLNWLRRWAMPFLVACFVLMIAAIIQGTLKGGTRGALCWLDLGFVRFQPSELAKLAYIIFAATLLAQGRLEGKNLVRLGRPLAIFFGSFCVLLFLQHDQGMMVLLGLITVAICFIGGMPMRLLASGCLCLAFAVAIFAFTDAERSGRICAWIYPRENCGDNGYQILTMLVALARGGLLGQGVGDSVDKWGRMPEAHTDAIFCVMGGEIGFLRMAAFLVLMGWIVWRAMQIGRWSRDSFGYFACTGIAIMIGMQTLINMAVATNLMPVTGLTLPYISYGGTSLVSCLIAAGLVLGVYRQNPPLRREN